MELQLALLLIGLIIVAVVALTTYERARYSRRRLAPRPGDETAAGAAGGTEVPSVITPHRHAPVMVAERDAVLITPHEAQERILKTDASVMPPAEKTPEAVLNESLNDFEQAALMPFDLSLGLNDPELDTGGAVGRRNMPDEAIDFVVTLPGKGPVSRNTALGVYRQNEYMLEKPRHIYGLGYKTGLWSNMERDPENAQYRSIAVSIQLVDTHGPINETELNTFTQMALKLADTLQRPTKLSLPFEDALARAQELDEFCETNDVLASLNLIANGPTGFSGRAIDQVARHFNLYFGAMNIYHRRNDQALGNPNLFSLANLYNPGAFDPARLERFRTQGLTLFMNVPCSYQPVTVFNQLVETARGMAKMLDGRLEDHDKHALTEQGIQVIRTQIERISTEMTNRGIVPGSVTAMRLFS
jgi:cell division protein ZipA